MKSALQAWYGFVAIGVMLVLSGCANGLTQQQRMWLTKGQEHYEREDFAGAIDQLSRFLSEVQEGPGVAQALYLRGMSNAQAGHRPQAYADLRRCVATPDNTDSVWRAYVVLGTLHFEDRQWPQAAENLRAAAERMPAAAGRLPTGAKREPAPLPKDIVLYRLGLCYERTGRWDEARRLYHEIMTAFPTGSSAPGAQRRYNRNAHHFAVQCGAFRDRGNAETLRDNLQAKGLEAYVQQEVHGRTPIYLVLIGRYAAYDEALSQLAMIQQFVPDAILWP
jgi:tetratricopeptide (TPR) repeat protein